MVLKYLNYLKKRWYVFLITFVLVAVIAFVAQSYMFQKEKGGSGKVIEVDVYRLIDMDMTSLESANLGETSDYDMSLLWGRSTLLSELADHFTETYDMETVCVGWNNMALKYQVQWIQEQFPVYHVPNSMIYEIRFYKEIAESQKETMQPLMESLMDDYVEFAMKNVQLTEKNLKYDIVKSQTYIRDQIVEAADTFRIKEVLLSVLLGVLGGLLVATIMFVRKEKV